MTYNTASNSITIEDLPDEVLEFILGLIPPYKDLHDCMVVSKRWRRCVLNVTKTRRRNLNRAILDFDITWKSITPVASTLTITKRYSHSAVVHENSMYVFGGCTCSMTTFNDLWRLDLSSRQWIRPPTTGNSYPSPKACSTMVCYKDFLVLFGGWTYPPSYPLHQIWHLFNELHLYDINSNKWISANACNSPPPTAGHSVSLHKEWMVVFGGLQRPSFVVHSTKTNDIWKLNLETLIWYKQETQGHIKPQARYGHSQMALDDNNLLIIGGSGGPSAYYNDVWVLNMTADIWRWISIEVRNMADAPANLWSNPACKVGDKIIVLNRIRQSTTPPFMYYSKGVWVSRDESRKSPRIDLAQREVDRDENVNGRRGTLKNHKRQADNKDDELNAPGQSTNRCRERVVINDSPMQSGLSLSAFSSERQHPLPMSRKEQLQEKRLEHLQRIQDEIKSKSSRNIIKKNMLGIYVLDISHALDEKPYVTWLPMKNTSIVSEGPEETILYSLVEGKSELIMFGGIQKDPGSLALTTNLESQVSNSVHFITAPKYVV